MKSLKNGKNASGLAGETTNADTDTLEMLATPSAELKADPLVEKSTTVKKKPGSRKARSTGIAESQAVETKVQRNKRRPASASSPIKKTKQEPMSASAESVVTSEPILEEHTVEPSDPLASLSPIDRLLAQPALPVLERENRARLQMQSPTKLHFYWSVRENPWANLRKAFGTETGSYTLVLKLVEMRSGSEQIHNADADGSWWFDVRPDGEYRAEIGFYAANRPYIRIVFSNVIQTPRLKPSPHKGSDSDWTVSSQKFAKVLDVAGFSRDAFNVAVAGDDPGASATAARQALRTFANGNDDRLAVIAEEDIRYAMLAFAEGQKLDDLRWRISSELFDYFQESGDPLDAERAESALREHFELDEIEFDTEENGAAVFGASLVNFPRTARSKRRPRISSAPSPEGSHSYGRMRPQ